MKDLTLYKIRDIEFNPDDFIEQSKIIKEKFDIYNKHIEFCPFDTHFLIMQMLKYEARNSNLIEGIYTSNIDILASDDPTSKKITNYLRSLKTAIKDFQKVNIFTKKSILDIHKNLFDNIISTDAINATPGQWRIRNAKIANHTPPNPLYIDEYIDDYIEWLNDDSIWADLPLQVKGPIKVAIAHAYFEKIHPFSDGNGRVGRILINLIINSFGLSNNSCFFLSKSILENQFEYYVQLEKIDSNTNYKDWIKFFLNLIIQQLDINIDVIKKCINLLLDFKNDSLLESNLEKRLLKTKIIKFIAKYPIFTYTKLEKSILNNEEISIDLIKTCFDELSKKFSIKQLKGTSFLEFVDFTNIIV
ncbi:Fic family protein [Spiroplasma turonicum]|uniref:Fic family protein n=1 Tax=Spiroplasma turonicum TaxID=216946 RepID=A0A0K1P7D3_9MOLU|nr:Fic family protein [Spiroplasma turonicum]AKU80198.1 Fic family protein [Spiroplasma turonicum]ALX71198.1 Fic family protein [Spiroplasma turonicum]